MDFLKNLTDILPLINDLQSLSDGKSDSRQQTIDMGDAVTRDERQEMGDGAGCGRERVVGERGLWETGYGRWAIGDGTWQNLTFYLIKSNG